MRAGWPQKWKRIALSPLNRTRRSMKQAKATGEVLSTMDPNFIGAPRVILIPGTPLYEDFVNKKFELPDEIELIIDLREMIRHTNFSFSLQCFVRRV
jgi:hypothetical protein